MKKRTRILGIAVVVLLLAASIVFATVAYLTSTDEVKNSFTVGAVEIKLDEAKTDEYGVPDSDAQGRVKENSYKLIPGRTYTKDPTVTVLAGSEEAYVRMIVTVSKLDELDAIFDPEGADLTAIFGGYNNAFWTLVNPSGTRDTENNTISYEFRYVSAVAQTDIDVALTPLFTSLTVPGTITGEQLATIEGMSIDIVAHAIQADGFANAAAAWAAFGA